MTDQPSVYEQVFGVPAPAAETAFAAVSQERVVDGLWARGVLGRRDRRLLTLAVVAASPNDAALEAHLDGALRSGDLTAAELDEAAVHLAHYAGWPVGARLSAALAAAVERARATWPLDRPVGVVGVGALGGDVARALVAAGAEVVVHDARPEAATAVEGATAADGLADLAGACGVIGIVVRDDAQVLDVVGRVAPAAAPGTVLLVHSTVSVATVERAAGMATASGLSLLDVGLCRPAGLDSGLVALVGGDPGVAAAVAPVLRGVARHVHHVGPLGTGMIVKAVRNAVIYGAYAGVSEAVDVCRAAGVDVEQLLRVLEDSGASGAAGLAFAGYREGWVAGAPTAPGSPDDRAGYVELARKDLGVAVEVAAAAGIDAAVAVSVAEAMPMAYLLDRD